tara:strand:- start:367 stop:591 length:225 start_codon:yes stop_codon:yes gene_type:complete
MLGLLRRVLHLDRLFRLECFALLWRHRLERGCVGGLLLRTLLIARLLHCAQAIVFPLCSRDSRNAVEGDFAGLN